MLLTQQQDRGEGLPPCDSGACLAGICGLAGIRGEEWRDRLRRRKPSVKVLEQGELPRDQMVLFSARKALTHRANQGSNLTGIMLAGSAWPWPSHFLLFRVSLLKLLCSMAEGKPEKRARQRVPVRLPLSIKVENSQIQGTAHTRDLNSGGMFFYTDEKIGEGTELEIVVVLPGELTFGEGRWVCCQASVVRVENAPAAGNLGIAAKIHRYQILPEI